MHTHSHNSGSEREKNLKNIRSALLINLVFTFVELVGGFLSNSVAIISDAVHDLGDTIGLSFAYFSERFAGVKTSDSNYTYGLNRLPLLSAFLNSVILLAGSAFIIYHAIPRLLNPEQIHSEMMFVIAVVGVAANGIGLLKLRRNKGLNSKVMGLHLLEDALGWLAVLIASVFIYFFDIYIIDPILSLIITLYILINVFKNIASTYRLFMQKSPESLETPVLTDFIKSFSYVKSVEDFHLWSLEGTRHVLTAHITVDDNITQQEINEIKNKIRSGLKIFGDIHSTLEIERESESCGDHC